MRTKGRRKVFGRLTLWSIEGQNEMLWRYVLCGIFGASAGASEVFSR